MRERDQEPAHDELDRKLDALLDTARLVLESGGETYRVEETVTRMARGLGLEKISVVAFPTSIFVVADGRARLRRITSRGTNMRRLVLANDVSRLAAGGRLTLPQLERALEAISRAPGQRQLVSVLACGLACGALSVPAGAGPVAAAAAFLIGVLVQAAQPLFSHMAMGALFGNFAGGLLAALVARAVALVVPYPEVNAAITGGIMPMLSGLLMTTAVRDTMYGDLVSGVARAVEALLLAASVALGVYVGLELTVLLGGIV